MKDSDQHREESARTSAGPGQVDLVTQALPAQTAEQWRRDNREAIAAYERWVEVHGIWNESQRPW